MGRTSLAVALLCGLICGNVFAAQAGEEEEPEDQALRRGIAWLVEHQNEDGSWTAPVGFKLNQAYQAEEKSGPHVAVTAFAALALLSRSGQLDDQGQAALKRAGEFLIGCADPLSGYISRGGTRMYGHALATLFFAEAKGRLALAKSGEALERAVQFLVKTQNEQGGWRYEPFSPDTDLSVTACVLQALGAARQRGVRVSQETFDQASDLLEKLYVTKEEPAYFMLDDEYYFLQSGSFRYQDQENSRSSFALTAAGLAAERACGKELSERAATPIVLDESYRRLAKHTSHYFYWYSQFHGVQALCRAGGEPWQRFQERSRADMLRLVGPDGSWPNETGPGTAFATAIACLVLQAPNGGLTILESGS
ncbi:MAG: prenyltransferase/squalene oxidase repeat-containing protein [Planctomycetota bacterium]